MTIDTLHLYINSPWVMMVLGLATHLLLKAMKGKDTTKRNEEAFSAMQFVNSYIAPLILSIITSFVFTVISIDNGWPVWVAYFMSLSSSSALYNIYPVITNPNLWKSIAGVFVSRVSPPPNDTHSKDNPPNDTPPKDE